MEKMKKLLIATHNKGKIKEFEDMLKPKGIKVVSAIDHNLEEPIEDGESFHANALIKAEAAMKATGLPALADDSGLCVNALNGDPGIYSARWAGPNKDFESAMQRVHSELGGEMNRSAYFIAVLALAKPDGTHLFFEGRCDGIMIWPPRGNKGFGYDPMFLPNGYDVTFGEMEKEEKHKISHRAEALQQFLQNINL